MTASFTSFTSLPRYMGSQRNQIDAIGQLVRSYILDNDPLLRKKHSHGQASIIDMCSGSGVVSRWFKQQNWIVHSVDQEPYTWHWNYYAMQSTPETLTHQQRLYRELHGLPDGADIVAWWNIMLSTLEAPSYFEKHYAPHENCQRMYFMPHVARWIDQALYWHTSQDWSTTPLIHSHFVSQICNAMIRSANTSGTMKSFHAQWGGPTGHRMADIQTLPRIEPFWLIEGPIGNAVLHDVTQGMPMRADIIYFDPPSSVQQFGSSYHLLNAFVQGHYRSPSVGNKHGNKSGILSGGNSSRFSKKATVARAWQEWIINVQSKSPWLVVTYPKEGLLGTEQIAMLLQQNGKNTVSRHDMSEKYVYIVKTNTWQSPKQLKRVLTKLPESPLLSEYCNPRKLTPRFSLNRVGSKINVYDQSECVAVISKRYKISWKRPPNTSDLATWREAQFSTEGRFAQYLIDRQWLSALTALRELKKTCKQKKQYKEHWTMLHHLAQAHSQNFILHRVNAMDWR